MGDSRVEAGGDTLVQEDGVEHLAGGRIQPEGNIRQAERGVYPRVAGF